MIGYWPVSTLTAVHVVAVGQFQPVARLVALLTVSVVAPVNTFP